MPSLFKVLSLPVTLLTTRVFAETTLTWTGYCPFDIKLAPSNDPKSLDLTYTPATNPPSLPVLDGKACLVNINFKTPELKGDVYLEEIEYTSNEALDIETKAAWDFAFAPILYNRVSTSADQNPVTASNSTWNTFPFCLDRPHSRNVLEVFVQTIFSHVSVGPDFRLDQKVRLRWGEDDLCQAMSPCDQPDIDMKFPSCHGVPGGYLGMEE